MLNRRTISLIAVFLVAMLLMAKVKVINGKVTAVKDGDTIEVLVAKKLYRIRLDGIDCPEMKQPYGAKAKAFASALVFGKMVNVHIKNKDRYNRHVGIVYLPDGKNLNRELVKAGLAWHYKAYSKDKDLASLEQQARKRKLGLWQDKNPIAPWSYRQSKRKK